MSQVVNNLPITLADVTRAHYRIKPHLPPTPLEASATLGADTWLKLENRNKMRAFKVRGALNAMLTLESATRSRGVIAASTGNHAQGVAYAAQLLKVTARIIMPTTAAKRKIAGVESCGAQVILHGDIYDAAEAEAHRRAHAEGLAYISPYADPNVIAGAGTIGLEILDQCPDVERIIVPIGGGGLISGIAVAVKSIAPTCEIIGVNAAQSPDMYNIFYGENLPLDSHTLADALPGDIEVTSPTRAITAALVDKIMLVTEAQIAAAMQWIICEHSLVGEGAGVAGIAALLHGIIPRDGKKTVVIISGGNVDTSTLKRILDA